MNKLSPLRGFTLIELLISIGIFSVFLVIVGGVFGRFVEVQRHSIEQGTIILEVQGVVETFIKEARTAYGSTYRSDDNGKKVAFNNQAGVCVSYQLRNDALERAEGRSNSQGTCDFIDSDYAPLTSKSVKIYDVFFYANPSLYDPDFTLHNQGVITLVLSAKSRKSQGSIPPLTVQNTVTSRQVRAYEP
ncbi:MAG: type II secretion system protein [bacterium]|nr:type II secretion system protein [bacterium]